MTDLSMLHQVDELVTRSHSDGFTAAALIEQHGRFLLAHAGLPDLDTPKPWAVAG